MAPDGTGDAARRSGQPDEVFHPRAEDIRVTDTIGSPQDDESLAKIRRSNAETEGFIEEASKLRAEGAELRTEERKRGRDARGDGPRHDDGRRGPVRRRSGPRTAVRPPRPPDPLGPRRVVTT